MIYEPSKELIEQIAKEVWADMKSKAEKPYYPLNLAKPEIIDKCMDFTKDICSYQTIRKALELYEMIPDETINSCRREKVELITNAWTPCPFYQDTLDEDDEPYCAYCDESQTGARGCALKLNNCPRPYKGKE